MEAEIQQLKPKKGYKKYLAVFLTFLLTGLIVSGLAFFYSSRKSIKLEKQVNILKGEIAELEKEAKALKKENKEAPIITENGIFSHLSDYLASIVLKKEFKKDLVISDGYVLVSSLLSNNKDRIVYTEITDTLKGSESNWKYNIYVKNIANGESKLIYSDFSGLNDDFSIRQLFVNDAKAGGCKLAYLPMAWSLNDKKIILRLTNPTSCGSGTAGVYRYYVIDSTGGEIIKLASDGAVFDAEYKNVVFVDSGDNSPSVCGGMLDNNYSRILHSKIEEEKSYQNELLAEKNAMYSVISLRCDGILQYNYEKYLDQECAKVDESTAKELRELNIYQIIPL